MTTVSNLSEIRPDPLERLKTLAAFFLRGEGRWVATAVGTFLLLYNLPVGVPRFDTAIHEALALTRWYAREHVLLCLVPAFFIAGAISVFVQQAAVMRYLGPKAPKFLSYGVASVSGTLLAVCSCTVLPLFAGIYHMGAGLGPATAFLYSGPAINALAIILTGRVLGVQLGVARAVGAVLFSIVIGLLMHFLFRRDAREKAAAAAVLPEERPSRPLWQNALFFGLMVAVLVFANWGSPQEDRGVFAWLYAWKWPITSLAAALLGVALVRFFRAKTWAVALAGLPPLVLALLFPEEPIWAFSAGVAGLVLVLGLGGAGGEGEAWLSASWTFTKQILPLLLGGVLVAGLLLGRPGSEGLVPSAWVAGAVGGNGFGANFFASVAGALMYFATLTEIPILEGLLGAGMGKGPALALLLAGPALSLPNMIVIRSVIGTKKTLAFIGLVVVLSTVAGLAFGAFA